MSADKGFEVFGKTVFVVALLILSSLINGLVLTRLWAWFIADPFDLQDLGIAEAIGLSLTARFVLSSWETPKSEQKTFGLLMSEAVARLIMANGFVLLLGLLVVQFT